MYSPDAACRTCVYFFQTPEATGNQADCRRFPPDIAKGFTVVDSEKWCGEYVEHVDVEYLEDFDDSGEV